LHVRFYSLII